MLLQQVQNQATSDSAGTELVPAAVSDTGCERELNEDRYAVVESASGLAWLVCDGMGGVQGGELAAQLVIDAIRRDLETFPRRPPELALKSAIQEANRVIILRRQNPAFSQMGTTVVGVIMQGPEVVVAHVGDSRAYLIRDGAIQQLTTDHTYVQEMVSKGQIRPEDALSHPEAHILTRAAGSEPALEIDTLRLWLWAVDGSEPKDSVLLCTDGLYSLVSEIEVAEAVRSSSPQGACARLVELARSRGGYDNITVAIVPMAGQLHVEPPPGFTPEDSKAKGPLRKPSRRSSKGAFARRLVASAVLSIFVAVMIVVVMAWFARSM